MYDKKKDAMENIKKLLEDELPYCNFPEKLKLLCGFLIANPTSKDELLKELHSNGYEEAYHYISKLSPLVMRSLSYSRPRMDARIKLQDNYMNLVKLLGRTFVKGAVYPKSEVKRLMELAYRQLGINVAGRASDLGTYLPCKEVKNKRGTRLIKIL